MAAPRFPILFITSTRIGDAVLSSGLIKRLVDEVPHARFTIAAGPLAAPLFRDTPGLEALIPLEKQPLGRPLVRTCGGRCAGGAGAWCSTCGARASPGFLRARRRAVRKSLPAAPARCTR